MQYLTYIDDFLALIQHRSFSTASKAQCITQPAFSRRIKLLEESLGTILFNRNTQPVTLTQAGEIFLQHAKSLKNAATYAHRDIQEHLSALENPIKLATSHTLAVSFLPEFLKKIIPSDPIPLKLSVKNAQRCLSDLKDKQVDFLLLHTHDKHPLYTPDECESHTVGTDQLMSVQSPQSTTPDNILVYTPETQLYQYLQEPLNQQLDNDCNVIFESSSGEVLKALCVAGHGSSIIPKSLIQKELSTKELIQNSKININIPLQIQLIRLKGNRNRQQQKQENIWKNAEKQAIIE